MQHIANMSITVLQYTPPFSSCDQTRDTKCWCEVLSLQTLQPIQIHMQTYLEQCPREINPRACTAMLNKDSMSICLSNLFQYLLRRGWGWIECGFNYTFPIHPIPRIHLTILEHINNTLFGPCQTVSLCGRGASRKLPYYPRWLTVVALKRRHLSVPGTAQAPLAWPCFHGHWDAWVTEMYSNVYSLCINIHVNYFRINLWYGFHISVAKSD